MKLSFHGAARSVTGSCHLLEIGDKKLLVDCGLYQGGRELGEENEQPFGFDPQSIDFLLLTHAHLDHCGRIPLLVKSGFRGEIIATAPTRELARIVMLDSAHLHEEDARRRNRSALRHANGHNGHNGRSEGGETQGRERRGNHSHGVESLYTVLDALNSIDRFGRTARYGKRMELAGGIAVTFMDAGHILGSASVLIEAQEGQKHRRILFSGDLGNAGRPLLPDPAQPPEVDVVVMETTYGDRRHRSFGASVEEIYQAINDTFARGGNVIIPTFALERAQEILYCLGQGVENGKLQRWMQVFLDSPMAISATEVYRRYPDAFATDVAARLKAGIDPFSLQGLHLACDASESMAINRVRGGAIIMAGSGMCTGGRVRHHLRHNIWRPESSVVFIGYAANGTLARRLIDGASEVRIFGEEIKVRARIYTINGFSAHADQPELLAWLKPCSAKAKVFLVHGDEAAMKQFAGKLPGETVMPALHEAFDI